MTTIELRAYVLQHRDDKEALHVYLDKLHVENPSPRVYKPEDSVAEAIAEYLKDRRQKQVWYFFSDGDEPEYLPLRSDDFLFFLAELSADRIIAKLELLVNTGAGTLSDPTRKHLQHAAIGLGKPAFSDWLLLKGEFGEETGLGYPNF